MAGRGPAPKANAASRGRGVQERVVVDQVPVARPVPPGVWHPSAVRWWESMSGAAVAGLWRDEDFVVLERGLSMVNMYWEAVDNGQVRDSVQLAAVIQRLETALWLNPAERARHGIKSDVSGPVQAVSGGFGARDRLRALDGGGADAVGQ